MPTIVVNIRLAPFDVYIGRPGRGVPASEAIFGNPFRPGEGGRQTCLERYRDYLLQRIAEDPAFRRRVRALRGKRLGCFCSGKRGLPAEAEPRKAVCHGQLLAAAADGVLRPGDGHEGRG